MACEQPELTVDSMDPSPVRTETALARKKRVPKGSSEVLESFIADTKERWSHVDRGKEEKSKKLEEYLKRKLALGTFQLFPKQIVLDHNQIIGVEYHEQCCTAQSFHLLR